MENTQHKLDAISNGSESVEATASTSAPADAPAEKSLTLDEAVSRAFDQHAKADQATAEPTKPTGAEATAEPAKPAPTEAEAAPPPEATAEAQKPVDPITGRTLEPIKAPAGWTPALREKWGAIDPQVQKFITDRERDMSQTLNKTTDERKLASEFREIVSPYEAMLRQFNTTATAHARELFTLSHTLNTGTPQVRAQVIHNLITHFKPDVATLQALASGQQPLTSAPPPVNVQEEVQKVLAEREAQTHEQAAKQAIDSFAADPANEFYDDVRALMGKAIDAGFVEAPTLPELFKKAYDFACRQHPEVSAVLARRAAASQASPEPAPAPQPVAQVKPSLGGGKSAKAPPKNISLDEAISLAMKKHGVEI